MKKTFKSMLALMLVAVMCFGLVGTAAFAEEISWTDGDGNTYADLAGNYTAASNEESQGVEVSAEAEESGSLPLAGSAPFTVSVDAGSYSWNDSVVTITPNAGRYVKSIKLDDVSVMGYVSARLESTVVSLDVDDLEDLAESGTLVVTTEPIPEEIEYLGAYAETLYGNFEFSDEYGDLDYVLESIYSEPDKDGNTSFLGYNISDEYLEIVEDYSGVPGIYVGKMYIVYDNGASVSVPLDEDTGIRSLESFKPVLPFSVKCVFVVNIEFTIGGEFESYDAIPTYFDQTDARGINVKTNFDPASNNYYNTVVSAQGNELEENEYHITLLTDLKLTNQAELTITIPTETKTYNGKEQSVGAPTLSVKEADLGIKDVVYLYNGSTTKPTEPGTYTVTFESYTITDKGAAVENPYSVYTKINLVAGQLVIAPIEIKVTLKDASAKYDGLPHSPAYDVVGTFMSEDDKSKLTLSFDTSATYYKDTPEKVTFVSGTVDNSNSSHYSVVCTNESAYVTITKAPITFTVGSCTKEYTGSPITATIKNETHPDGDVTVTGTPFACAADKMDPDTIISGSAENAGKYQVLGLDGMKIFGAGGVEVTSSYDIKVIPGTLTITPKAGLPKITITIKGAEKTYDGKDLILSSTATLDAEAQKTVGSVIVTDLEHPDPKDLNLGSKPFESTLIGNNLEVKLIGTDGISPLNNSLYSIEIVPAYAAIKKATLNITPASVTKNYDGNPYSGVITKSATFGGEAVTISAKAYAYKGDATSDGVAVGTYTLKVDPASVTIKNKDDVSIVPPDSLTDYFNINCTASTLTVKASIGAATYSQSAGGTVTITCSLPKDLLSNVVVGNTILVENVDYTVNQNANGTAVTFKDSEYLKNLAVDNYTVVFNYKSPASTSMTTTLKVTQYGVTSSTASPQTGDTSNTTLWIVILAVCFVAIVAVVVIIIRQKKPGKH